MSARNLLHLYRIRLRARAVLECFALLGIASGVALLFASQVASNSLTGSLATLSHGVVGDATLQLQARDDEGMPQSELGAVRAIAGVRATAPLLEASAQASGPRGSRSVELIGADSSLRGLHGTLGSHADLEPFAGIGAVVITSSLAHALGVTHFGQEVTLKVAGRSSTAPLYEQLGERRVGALASSPVIAAPLFYAQELAGREQRVSRILVASKPGQEAAVREALVKLAANRLNVTSTSNDETLFAKASSASSQSTLLFSVISAVVGFLFAFNAMLLTVSQRRGLVRALERDGYAKGEMVGVLVLDALALGLLASAAGVAAGLELATRLFGESPGYLGSAFALGSQRVVGWQPFLVAIAGGLLASVVAVLGPVSVGHERRSARPLPSGTAGRRPALVLAAACILVSVSIAVLAPHLAVLGILAAIAAMLLLLGRLLGLAGAFLARLSRRTVGAAGHLATMELSASRSRAVGVAATGAVAVFGAIAIQGAHADLLRGLENAARDENALTDIWVSPPGAYNLLRSASFRPALGARIQTLPGVESVAIYRGALLNWGSRRVWVIAPPPDAEPLLPASQILQGPLRLASMRVRDGGIVLSKALAEEHHVHIGELVRLPTPVPSVARVAALSTNVGWAPGAVMMNSDQFARSWGSSDASAFLIHVARGHSVASIAGEVRRLLGPGSGLSAQTAAAHEAEENSLSRQGLDRLTQIAVLVLGIAVLAMAAAVGSMLWQRRPRLAGLRLEGFSRADLWRTASLEAGLLIAVGCVAGAVFGLYGQQLLDRALATVINLPVASSVALGSAALGSLAVVLVALAIVAVPGYFASGVEPGVALED